MKSSSRLIGVDAARGVALLGMITLHSLLEETASGNPTWSSHAFSGRAAAAFALMSGVGLTLATGRRQVPRSDARGVAAMLATRALCIGVIGLLVSGADTVLNSVILPYYAVVFLLAVPLVLMPTWALFTTGASLALVAPFGMHLLLPHLAEPSLGDPTFGRLIDDPLALLGELTLTGYYPAPAWLAYICVGLAIGRLDLSSPRVAATLLAAGAVLGVWARAVSTVLLHLAGGLTAIHAAQPASGLTSEETTYLLKLGGDGSAPTSTWWWLAVDGPHTGTPLNLVGTIGSSVAVLGLALLLSTTWARPLLVPLAAAGSMTLTFYSVHVLFLNSDFDTYSPVTGCIVQLVAVVLIAMAVRATAGRGPLEALVGSLARRARALALRPAPAVSTDVAAVVPRARRPEPASLPRDSRRPGGAVRFSRRSIRHRLRAGAPDSGSPADGASLGDSVSRPTDRASLGDSVSRPTDRASLGDSVGRPTDRPDGAESGGDDK
ncbi:heparan-alpha-glucosaminide N-acetyltransferase domain-containing protein [Dactylosporangium sp. AC04546]|uniref:heparan-alpha-glucosaminide N-acetyltransferase domain-containing protein n=1 Tax=Dactylosporangium sp. AC04546 TaxID=2862460 RepID=UPI001EDF7244|nr:heparan-alpha-glucosaminide N-acetyltransferase domain-containing protein [Dactylosporangium sp. AC04546]WVK87921.1 heparan-alpha-glucosaminide N-acetyltransferase domain-containing protein [Dactylosporangium sp. AC04546]